MTDSSSQRDESESASTPAIADAPTEDAVFDMPSCMPGEALYNCDLLTPEEYKNATNTGAQLIQLVSEMLRTVDESIRESEAKGENRLSMNETLTDLLVATEVPPERPTIQLAVKHAPEQYLPSADDSHRSSASFSGFPDKFPESIRETLPPEADPFAIREGMTLAWKDVNLTVKGRGKIPDRRILQNVWGEVPKKETTAIMGSSGAGKTSLMNVLSGRTASGGNVQVKANITLDQVPADPTKIGVRQMIAFVAQDDSLQVTATPREAIRFSAKLRLGRSLTDDQLDIMTQCMLHELGLTACADTIVGGPLIKGISGGERKRTSVGVELVVKPAMLFLDEPTSGLDSFSAVQLCQLLKKVARVGASVMFTIHQPSSRIFREFDQLILLNKGRVMYQGPVSTIADYFGARGHPCPRNYNPADWIMKVAQKVPIQELEEAGFFPKDERKETVTNEVDTSELLVLRNQSIPQAKEKPPTMATEISMLIWRELVHIRRAKSVTVARIIQSIVLASVIGLIFFDVGNAPNDSVSNLQGHFGAIIMVATIIMMGPAQAALLSFPDERPVFLREYSTKHYSVSSYFLSRLSIEAMMGALQSMLTTLICYFAIDFRGSFINYYGACFTLAMGSTAIAVILGAAAGSSSKIATAALPLVLLPQMLFVGYFVSPELIPVWLRWIQYICPMTYATRILLVSEFETCEESFLSKIYCQSLLDNTGADPDEVLWYWCILIGQFVVFRLIALAILHKSAQRFY
ncbi:ATP-binding cassette, subfamily G (WHITE), member 2 [Fistulifera solaris]|uniref:ATP-binding cassette, subfamily G (WHITE), member 2 n=1 Tax=Fistulifera solaris TaxID=1519565 RepID=A0A1Z5K7P9_FISSO|nr:ATP-binding cassette, subfamily G (WHITE), member 2 [Fistulifera solaris]|eukprot:GAX22290.1 ATP-binding cassette, subfamily G (WHITE), member 2 [Fistulifera solaris]